MVAVATFSTHSQQLQSVCLPHTHLRIVECWVTILPFSCRLAGICYRVVVVCNPLLEVKEHITLTQELNTKSSSVWFDSQTMAAALWQPLM